MALYRVVGSVVASKYLGEFEADSPEQAVEMALDSEAACISLCHACADECSDAVIETATAEMVEQVAE
jgi:ferredoxin